jgi:hypothetical protein
MIDDATDYYKFQIKITGDTSDAHQFQGYDGYMALAGFAWMLSLAAHFADTGEVRQRGDFFGRQAVRAEAPKPGSIIIDFTVTLAHNPIQIFGIRDIAASSAGLLFMHDLVKRLLSRNLGKEHKPQSPILKHIVENRDGDLEALVAKVEPAIKQAHRIIGNGATRTDMLGGFNIIGTFNNTTKEYVNQNIEDTKVKQKDFSVAAFNANSGYGSVFDFDLNRTIPISMQKDTLRKLGGVFSWGLDKYATGTGERISMKYISILAMDGTPKRYVVLDATKTGKVAA